MYKSSNPFYTLKIQLLLIFLVLGTVPSLILGIIAGNMMYRNEFNKSIDYSQSNIEIIANNINTFTDQCLEYAQMVSQDNNVQEVLRKSLGTSLKNRYKQELEISALLYFYNQSIMSEVFGIYVIGENGIQCSSNSMPFISPNLNTGQLYQHISNSSEPIWFANHGDSNITVIQDKNFYSVGIPIINKATGTSIGIVLIEFDDMYFSKMTNPNNHSSDNILYIKDYTGYHYSKNEFSHAIHLQDDNIFEEKGMIYFADNNNKYVYTETVLNSGYDLISLVNLKQMKQNSLSLAKFIIVFTLLLTIISAGIFMSINSIVFGPVEELKKGIELVQDGEYNICLSTNANNEFGTLVNGFNKMIDTIHLQMDKIYTHQRNLRKANLDVLQAQINPHFLYNTLDSIIWLARAKDAESIITLTGSLIKFLRIGLSHGFKTITIQDELSHVESYLRIQKIRYQDSLNYSVEYPEEAALYYIPKLTLQPLVENSIMHGIDSSHHIGTITIRCDFTQENVNIFIEDTGVGIDAETLSKINSMTYKPSNSGIGIKNVNERLRLYYNNSYQLNLTSKPTLGTCVHIQIPKETEAHDD